MELGAILPFLVLAIVIPIIVVQAKKEPSLRMRYGPICRAHGGDGIETCETCLQVFCRECQLDGHCGFQSHESEDERWASQ